jgi:WD40 repeat protein
VLNGLPGIGGVFHTADIICLAVGPVDTPAGKLVATGCGAGDVFVTQMEAGTVVTRLRKHEGGAETLAFSGPAVRPVLLATGGGDGVIRVWDAESGVERCRLDHAGVTVRVVWHPALPLLASASADGTVALWDALGGRQLALFRGHTDFVTDVCFAGGDQFLASSSADESVRVFDIRPLLPATAAH